MSDKKTQVYRIMGPMIAVRYPYRKTPDLYVALDGKPVFCAQCEQTFDVSEFPDHILSHDRRRRRK